MCGIIGYVGPRECKPLLLQGLERLEYRGYDSAGIALREEGGLEYVRAVGNLQNLKDAAGPNGSTVDARARAHALGHARRRHRGERAPACRLRRVEALDRPERDRRELPRAPREPPRRGPRVRLRDRRRDRHAPDRAPLRGRPRRGRAPDVPRPRGPFHLRRDPPRPSGRARRGPPPDAARGRDRRGRDVPRLERGRVPARDPPRPVPGRRRHRRDHARRGDLHARRRERGRARAGRARLGRRGRREGRLRDVHAQGDLRAVGGRRRDDRRPRPPRHARARGPRADRGGSARAAPDRDPRLRHRLPRGRRRALRDRGVGAGAGRARHRLGVDLPQPRDRRGHARDRHLAVGRDARHDRGDEARPREGRAHRRDHEHDGLADHARGRLGSLHPLRARGRRRRLEDLHLAGRAALPRRAQARAGARDDACRRDLLHPRQGLRAPGQDRAVPRRRPPDRGDRAALLRTSRSSSISAATSVFRSLSRAR